MRQFTKDAEYNRFYAAVSRQEFDERLRGVEGVMMRELPRG